MKTGNIKVEKSALIEKNLGFISEQVLTISSGAAVAVDWDDGNTAGVTLTESVTITLTAPTNICNVLIKIVQGGSGSYTVTWATAGAETIKWEGGSSPTLSTAVGAIDIISLYWDGQGYYASAILDFS